jgi:hypothetical protein
MATVTKVAVESVVEAITDGSHDGEHEPKESRHLARCTGSRLKIR